MNIFLHEVKANGKSTIIWTLSLAVLVVFFLSIYPSFAKDTEEFTKILAGYPEPIRNAFGIHLENFFTIIGYYCFPFSFITLFGAIQAMNLGTAMGSQETREKTADFLFTKPVTRKAVLTAKILASTVSLVMTNIVYIASGLLMANQVKTEDFSEKIFIMISLTMFLIQLIFLALGILISVIVPKIKSVLSVSLSTVFAFYFLGMLSDSGEEAKRYITPFKYFDTAYIMNHSSYETSFLIVGAIIVLFAIVASYVIFTKKDIHAV